MEEEKNNKNKGETNEGFIKVVQDKINNLVKGENE